MEALSAAVDQSPYVVSVVEPDPKLRTRLAMLVGEAAAETFAEVGALVEHLRPGQAAVVIFGPGLGNSPGLGSIQQLTRSRPDVGAILVADELSTALLQEALRSGVRDVLGSPTESQVLLESIERVAGSLNLASAAAPPVAAGPAPERGRVITVSSTKGGSGKSVVATNLAALLAQRSDRPVVLVDADLQFGDVAVMLRLTAAHTIVDAVSAMNRLDAQYLQSLLVRHDPSGLLVLPAPIEPSFAERVSGADMLQIVEILQSFCSYVIVDTPASFNDVVLALIEHSDDVILVAGMDIPNIKNVKLGLQTLRLLSIPESKLMLLLNRANSKVKLDVSEVERTLGLKAESLIPSDIVVPQTVNKGTPVVLDAPKSEVARAFERLADSFFSSEPAVPMNKSRGRFGLF